MDADLLAYLLDALDPEQARALEEHLENTPEARRRLVALRALLKPLDLDADPTPPPDLYMNTLRGVAAYRTRNVVPGPAANAPILPFPLRQAIADTGGP